MHSARHLQNGRRVAIALFSDKETKVSAQASSEVGAADGDSQVNWITPTEGPDRSNAHVAVFDDQYALVTWEQIDEPSCDFIAMGCSGTFSGSYFQLVDSSGSKIGEPVVSNNTYVAGDMVTMNDGSICWPYVNMEWSLDAPSGWGGESTAANVTKMSFACMSLQ